MEVLALTVLFSAILALLAMAGFAWDHANRGKDGLEREALRPLEDDAPPPAGPPLD
jgi:hypothetical protein